MSQAVVLVILGVMAQKVCECMRCIIHLHTKLKQNLIQLRLVKTFNDK